MLKAVRLILGYTIVFISFLLRPKKVKRSHEAQSLVNQKAANLSLYQFYACPFCVKVRRAIHRLNIPISTKDAQNDNLAREELQSGGGKVKVPCLRIEEEGKTRWMYESSDIILYLEKLVGETDTLNTPPEESSQAATAKS